MSFLDILSGLGVSWESKTSECCPSLSLPTNEDVHGSDEIADMREQADGEGDSALGSAGKWSESILQGSSF